MNTGQEIAAVPFVVDLDVKAVTDTVQLNDGELLLEGWALNYDIDREDESFSETGSIHKALKKLAMSRGPVCFHHDYKTILGRVIDAEPVVGKGVKVRAIVDYQPEGSPWRHYYDAIKSGSIRHLSLGGIFKRKMTTKGPIIHDADFFELSVCGTSVGRGTSFDIIAGKALKAPIEGKAEKDMTEDEVKVAEAAAERGDDYGERGNDKEVPTTPSPIEPAPERKEEEEAQEEVREDAIEEAKDEATPFVIEDGAITAEKIASGSITTAHLHEDLRSRFQELKPEPEEAVSVEELSAALAKMSTALDAVGKRIGMDVSDTEKNEITPTSGPVLLS